MTIFRTITGSLEFELVEWMNSDQAIEIANDYNRKQKNASRKIAEIELDNGSLVFP